MSKKKETKEALEKIKLLKKQEACKHDREFTTSTNIHHIKNNSGDVVSRVAAVTFKCMLCDKDFYIPHGAVPMVRGEAFPVREPMVRTDAKTILIPIV